MIHVCSLRPRFACIALVFVLTLAAGGTTGCGKHGVAGPGGGVTLPPSKVVLHRTVELAVAQRRSLVSRVETIGVLEAEGQTDIAAGVAGVVDSVLFREGDEVKAGTLLVTVDQARYQSEEELARANVERAKAAWDLARDLAARADRAGAGVSEEDRSKARGQLRVSEAEHRSAVAAHSRAANNLDRSRVRAPYAGRINKRLLTKGSYLEERTPIATIADLSRIRLVGYVPETAAPVVRDLLATQEQRLLANRLGVALTGAGPTSHALGRTAAVVAVASDLVPSGFDPEFQILALPGQSFLARIFFMSTVANIDTHMFECKAEVLGWRQDQAEAKDTPVAIASRDKGPPLALASPANPLSPQAPKLWPGFTAKINFPLRSSPDACTIPEESVRHTERGHVVFVPEEQSREGGKTEWVARARVLDLGFRGDGWVEVRQGLRPGDRVVHRGAEALEDGTPIAFKK